jgi:hypothetical protein
MNFVVYHSALRPFLEWPDRAWAEFESTDRIRWASDLAEIPQRLGVTNNRNSLRGGFEISLSVQLIEQDLGLFQVAGVEAFGEPAVDCTEKIARLRLPTMMTS